MKFLIDECLATDLVALATDRGHAAEHVAQAGMAGWRDWNLLAHAAKGDFVFVTTNAADFGRLAAARSDRAGVIVIIPTVNPWRQMQLFRGALDLLGNDEISFQRVLEIDIVRWEATFTIYDLPPPA